MLTASRAVDRPFAIAVAQATLTLLLSCVQRNGREERFPRTVVPFPSRARRKCKNEIIPIPLWYGEKGNCDERKLNRNTCRQKTMNLIARERCDSPGKRIWTYIAPRKAKGFATLLLGGSLCSPVSRALTKDARTATTLENGIAF